MNLQDAAIATNRFGLGARPGEMRAIAADPRGWLKAQLKPENAPPAAIAALPTTVDASGSFGIWLRSIGITAAGAVGLYEKNAQASSMGAGAKMGAPGLPEGTSIEQSFIRTLGPVYMQAVKARVSAATQTDRPFFERLVHFWGNHFTISGTKPSAFALAAPFERDVVRAKCMGPFRNLLVASCKHPGMLTYLDNQLSIGPNSFLAKNPRLLPPYLRERMQGLNENLGREILELHTLGVRSGYSQADVTSLSKVITGWTVQRQSTIGEPSGTDAGDPAVSMFRFLRAAHEPGPKTVLGKVYNQDGLAQGEAVLGDVARHPATARFIASKLVRHFVADEPPNQAVERVAQIFRDSEGDLPAVCAGIVDLPEAWDPVPRKFKPPEDYLTSALRALNDNPALAGKQLVAILDRMGQRPYYAAGPNGWADVESEWLGPDAVWKRVEWADAWAKVVADAQFDPGAIAADALGSALTATTLRAIKQAESPAQGLALFLTAPEFQRR
jgi:uncharacterized protein (DUF1800 family)